MINAFRSILTGLLLMFLLQEASAQINIKKVWVECADGELLVHYNFDINGHIGKECEFISYFFIGGKGIKDTNGIFRTKNGYVSASTYFMPIKEKRTYTDFIVSIPITELHIPGGIIDENPIFPVNRIGIKFGILYKEKFLYLSDESDTHYFDLSYVNCALCMGNGYCLHCNGTGESYTVDGKNCTHCKKTGGCERCNGSGIEPEYPVQCINLGNIAGNPEINTSIGTRTDDTGLDTYTYDTSDGEDYNNDNAICPECNDKGFSPKKYLYAGGSYMPVYHNFSGIKCFICNELTEHYHYKCSNCRRY